MNVLDENKLTSNRSSTEQDKRCPLCLSDPFMSPNDKTKEWADQAKLQEHMSSEKHSRFATWERKMKGEHAMGGVTNDWKCPYCPDEAETLSTFSELVHHIEMSEASSTSAEHEQLKADDGWLDDDWMGTELTASSKRNRGNRSATRLGEGEYAPVPYPPQLPGPMPHPENKNLQLGYWEDLNQPPPPGIRAVPFNEVKRELADQPLPARLVGLFEEIPLEEVKTKLVRQPIAADLASKVKYQALPKKQDFLDDP